MASFDFVNRGNAEYIEALYQEYRNNPASVSEQWRAYFAGFEMGAGRSDLPTITELNQKPARGRESIGLYDLVHSYREVGHMGADLDPLGTTERQPSSMLELSNFDLTPADLDCQVGRGGFAGETDGTLRDLIEKLRITYSSKIGVEFTGIMSKEQRDWLQQKMESTVNQPKLSPEEKRALQFNLIAAEDFERYLHSAFVGAKRFSIEGGEALIPLLNTIVEHAGSELGGEAVIMAMAHRGRLNVLAHVLNKPYEIILSEFAGTAAKPAGIGGDGDVKYHLGYANTRPLPNGRTIKISLLPNPSHLELINPIQQGIIRCKQEWLNDTNRTKTIPVCLHGDAAFCGQGIVTETLSLSELSGYETGGTLHIITNNQIGFTTPPRQGRFTPYPTDMAKAIQAPIFHVNGDDPEAVVWVAKLAVEFRQIFKCDVIIDMWCYRRYGHNETDEPTFTQPLMYRKIQAHPTVRNQYAQRLVESGVATQQDLDSWKDQVRGRLDTARKLAQEVKPRVRVPKFGGVWNGFGLAPNDYAKWSIETRVPRAALERIISVYDRLPEGFTPHPKLDKGVIQARKEMVRNGQGIDWGCAEMLAFGSLLLDGTNIRFTGQDVERGTFSHRHAVLHDFNNGNTFTPLQHVAEKQGQLYINNSMLSEEAVLGFEWGYSSADPRNLVLWEAQFGDFVNGAQNIIDQIIAASESKWHYMAGLVMLLPHGYEGGGPEHSSAYVDRFLSLCAEDNIQVAMPSTPATYFHLLRRQQLRKFRKPLVLFMPKYILRPSQEFNFANASTIEEMTDQSLQLVIDDTSAIDKGKVRKVLLCAGKAYFLLDKARRENKIDDIAIIRLEQFYPLPKAELIATLAKYPRATEVSWVQEEALNRGAWTYMAPLLRTLVGDATQVQYYGRDAGASPATGSMSTHKEEERELVSAALDLSKRQITAQPITSEPLAVK